MQAVAREEKRGFHQFELHALFACQAEQMAHARRFLKAVMADNAHKARPQLLDGQPFGFGHARYIKRLDGKQNIALVQHFIVLHIVQQRLGHRGGIAHHIHRVARHDLRRKLIEVFDKAA